MTTPEPRACRGRFFRLCGLIALLVLAPEVANAHDTVHVVTRGQTLVGIAKHYHTTVDAIREANDLKPWQRLHPGVSLVIPDNGKEAAPARKPPAGKKDQGKPTKPAKTEQGNQADRGKKEAAHETKGTPRGLSPFKGAKRRGHVRLVRGSETLEVQLTGRRGHLAPAGLAGLSRMLRFYPTGAKIPIDPRLAALIGEVSDHFGGRPLHVVSGFRPYSPVQYTPHSNHNLGRAMDFLVEGVPNTVLRDFCRTFRNAGVGYYPNSSFVHLDVRTGKTYWIDTSRPGEPPHYGGSNPHPAPAEAADEGEPHGGAEAPPNEAPEADPGSSGPP